MKNKIKGKSTLKSQDLDSIYRQMAASKYQIESFCVKNQMKFPPIAHVRNSILMHLQPYSQIQQGYFSPQKPFADENESYRQTFKPRELQKKSSICKIIFQKSRRNSQKLAVSSLKSETDQNPANLLKNTINPQRTILISSNKKINRSHLNYRKSKNYERNSLCKQKEEKDSLLCINRMSTLDPQQNLLQTLRNHQLPFGKSNQKGENRYLNSKQIKRASFYINGNNFGWTKNNINNQSIPTKEISIFQPWQNINQLQQDYLYDLEK